MASVTDLQDRENIHARIRELSLNVSRRLFHDLTLRFIWGLAKDTEILSILTDLTEIPWEALVSRETPTAAHLSEIAIISRCLFTQGRVLLNKRPSQASPQNSALFVDNVLHATWTAAAATGANVEVYRKLLRTETPKLPKTIPALMSGMRGCRNIRWICENEFNKTDRLRICEGVHCTEDTIYGSRLTPHSVVFLFSCAREFNNGGTGIAAQIALHNMSTVVTPLVPISEIAALQMLYLLSARIRILKANGRTETISELIANMRRWGSNSSLRVWSSFIAIYGPLEAQLT